jgi:hypothetical protein
VRNCQQSNNSCRNALSSRLEDILNMSNASVGIISNNMPSLRPYREPQRDCWRGQLGVPRLQISHAIQSGLESSPQGYMTERSYSRSPRYARWFAESLGGSSLICDPKTSCRFADDNCCGAEPLSCRLTPFTISSQNTLLLVRYLDGGLVWSIKHMHAAMHAQGKRM